MSSKRASRRSSRPVPVAAGATLALAVLALVFFIYRSITGDLQPTPATPEQHTSGAGWWSVHFSEPGGPNAESLRGGPDAALAGAIDMARLSVDVAAYDLDLWSVRDSLLAAQRRGVVVRMVTESDNIDTREIQQIMDAGIQVLGDRREGLMHNKFTIIDGLEVWTGSMNYTINGAYRNDNNLLRIRSAQVANNFTTEFEEMFVDDRFGSGSPANTPYPRLTVDGIPVEIYFSPDDGVADRLVELIMGAKESIHFMAFAFTSDDIAGAMLSRADAGVTVSGVFEFTQVKANQGDEYLRLKDAGLDVRLDGNSRNMHHKVILIDGKILITGSYNFSNNAENSNDENVIIIFNSAITTQYLQEFHRVYALAQN